MRKPPPAQCCAICPDAESHRGRVAPFCCRPLCPFLAARSRHPHTTTSVTPWLRPRLLAYKPRIRRLRSCFPRSTRWCMSTLSGVRRLGRLLPPHVRAPPHARLGPRGRRPAAHRCRGPRAPARCVPEPCAKTLQQRHTRWLRSVRARHAWSSPMGEWVGAAGSVGSGRLRCGRLATVEGRAGLPGRSDG